MAKLILKRKNEKIEPKHFVYGEEMYDILK
jgi:hypothetical protein